MTSTVFVLVALGLQPMSCPRTGTCLWAWTKGSGFRVWCLGFRVWGSGFRVWVSGFRVEGLGSGFRVWGWAFGV